MSAAPTAKASPEPSGTPEVNPRPASSSAVSEFHEATAGDPPVEQVERDEDGRQEEAEEHRDLHRRRGLDRLRAQREADAEQRRGHVEQEAERQQRADCASDPPTSMPASSPTTVSINAVNAKRTVTATT